ncbi:MAG TPA: hypothetical protein VIK69_05170 [Methylophilaceae bacterium]
MTYRKFPPALTRDQLREIQAARRGDPDVRRLLEEIARLRKHLRQAEYVYRVWIVERKAGALSCAETHLAELRQEPCVMEAKADHEAHKLLTGPARKPQEMP